MEQPSHDGYGVKSVSLTQATTHVDASSCAFHETTQIWFFCLSSFNTSVRHWIALPSRGPIARLTYFCLAPEPAGWNFLRRNIPRASPMSIAKRPGRRRVHANENGFTNARNWSTAGIGHCSCVLMWFEFCNFALVNLLHFRSLLSHVMQIWDNIPWGLNRLRLR